MFCTPKMLNNLCTTTYEGQIPLNVALLPWERVMAAL